MEKTKDQATPRPWEYKILSQYSKNNISIGKNNFCIINSGVSESGEVFGVLKESDARLIVKAVNCHDELVEALKSAKQLNLHLYAERTIANRVFKKVKQALFKAEQ